MSRTVLLLLFPRKKQYPGHIIVSGVHRENRLYARFHPSVSLIRIFNCIQRMVPLRFLPPRFQPRRRSLWGTPRRTCSTTDIVARSRHFVKHVGEKAAFHTEKSRMEMNSGIHQLIQVALGHAAVARRGFDGVHAGKTCRFVMGDVFRRGEQKQAFICRLHGVLAAGMFLVSL